MIPALVAILFTLSLIFIFVPILPPGLFLFAGYLIYAHYTDYAIFNTPVLIVVGFFSIVSLFIDNILTFIGAKVFKASSLSITGMIVGMFAGLILGGPLGMLLGIFAGSFLGEFVNSTIIHKSLIVALGSVMGYFAGVFVKFLIIGGLIFYFLLRIFILKG